MSFEVGFDWSKAIESTCGPLVEAAETENLSVSKAKIEAKTDPHHHKNCDELYIVKKGKGILRVKESEEITQYSLYPGKLVVIEQGEIHQSYPEENLVVETVNAPPWREEGEVVAEEDLFSERK